MGWESRRNKKYFYRSVRVDGQPRKVYLGGGAVGEAHAPRDARERRLRQAERFAWEAERARLDGADAALDLLEVMTDVRAGAALLLAGYHEQRGQWRARR